MEEDSMRTNHLWLKRVAGVGLILMIVVNAPLFAGEGKGAHTKRDISNIGFIKNPPKELKEKFPMCDAFLKVEWIDKEKMIGYSHYDFYLGNRRSIKKAFALVHLDKNYPRFDYDLEQYQKAGRLDEIFAFIKRGEVYFADVSLSIQGENRGGENFQEDFTSIADDRGEKGNITFTLSQINVCINYPDNHRMWITEGNLVEELIKSKAVNGCEPSMPSRTYFTTNGKNFFLNNQCKLIKLTK
jgi:hypothetical protein